MNAYRENSYIQKTEPKKWRVNRLRLKAFVAMLCAQIILLGLFISVPVRDASAAGPSGKLGCQKTGLNSWACDTQQDLTILDAGSWQTAFAVSNPFSAFQTHEQLDITALVRFRTAPGGDASTMGGFQLRRMDGQYENGTFLGFGGDASDTLAAVSMGGSWLDSSAQLVQCTVLGQTECVQVFCERPCQISLSASYDINLAGDTGPLPDAGPVDSGSDTGADSGTDSGTDSGSPPIMSAFLTPNDGPSSGGTVITNTLTGGGCGTGTPTVVFSASGYSASATSISCNSGTGITTFTSPAFNVTTSSPGDITVTITTSGGTAASTGHLNSFHFLDSTNPWQAMYRGDSLASGTVTTWASNNSARTLTPTNSPVTTTVSGMNALALVSASTQYLSLGSDMCVNPVDGGGAITGNFTMVAIACTPASLNGLTNDIIGSFAMTGTTSEFGLGFDESANKWAFSSDLFSATASTASSTITTSSCYRVGASLNQATNLAHIVLGSTFGTPVSMDAIILPQNNFFIGAYRQGSTVSATFTGTLAELDVKCALDSDAVIQTELDDMKLSWNGTTVVN